MIQDEMLRNYTDYNQGQTEASHRILIELVSLFNQYKDDIRIVGGWVPDLMFPAEGHVGSVDVDVLVNHLKLKDSGYQTMARLLLKNGYREHPEKYFSFVKTIRIDDIDYDVDVDILAGMYGGSPQKKRSQHIQGIKALKATGGNFAFDFPPQDVKIESKRPDGALDIAHVNVIAVVPYIVMKTAAMGRGKAKDAYDIYFIAAHYAGGIPALANCFSNVKDLNIIKDMKKKLSEKFASIDHAGPVDVADFMEANGEEREFLKRDAYERIQELLARI